MKLLYVNACISQRGTDSRTKTLSRSFLMSWRVANPYGIVETVNLDELQLRTFDVEMLNARDALFGEKEFDHPFFALAKQFAQADIIVVAAPFWDLSYPAALRIYIEHVSANGVTYYYDEQGPHGSCAAQNLVYLTSGGDIERPDSPGVVHWRQLCGMYGIPNFSYIFVGGLDAAPEQTAPLLQAACEKAATLAHSLS